MPKYPNVHVRLLGEDGNAFSILGRVRQAMKRAGLSEDDIAAYHAEATSGDYDNLLRVTMDTVACDDDDEDDEDDEDGWS